MQKYGEIGPISLRLSDFGKKLQETEPDFLAHRFHAISLKEVEQERFHTTSQNTYRGNTPENPIRFQLLQPLSLKPSENAESLSKTSKIEKQDLKVEHCQASENETKKEDEPSVIKKELSIIETKSAPALIPIHRLRQDSFQQKRFQRLKIQENSSKQVALY